MTGATSEDIADAAALIEEVFEYYPTYTRGAYFVTGSDIYGFPSPIEDGGDIDVRGFHVAPDREYTHLDDPTEQIIVNQGDTDDHTIEEYPHIDLVSYDLRKYGSLVAGGNFNILESLWAKQKVTSSITYKTYEHLVKHIESHLGEIGVAHSYYGMARHNYEKYLNPERDGRVRPVAKKYLYVLRGIYGARWVVEEGTVEPDVRRLAEHRGDDALDLVEDLIEVKHTGEQATVGPEMASRATERIDDEFDHLEDLDFGKSQGSPAYRQGIDHWMDRVREDLEVNP